MTTPTPAAVPAAVSTAVAAALTGLSRSTLTRRAGEGLDIGAARTVFPIRMGRAWAWPTAPILDALQVPADPHSRAEVVAFADAQVRAQYRRENASRGAAA